MMPETRSNGADCRAAAAKGDVLHPDDQTLDGKGEEWVTGAYYERRGPNLQRCTIED